MKFKKIDMIQYEWFKQTFFHLLSNFRYPLEYHSISFHISPPKKKSEILKIFEGGVQLRFSGREFFGHFHQTLGRFFSEIFHSFHDQGFFDRAS